MKSELSENSVDKNPFLQFNKWFDETLNTGISMPEAMVLTTANAKGASSTRTVLLKETNESGFVFFTNYSSRKAKEIGGNPQSSLLFYWKELERQVRIEGIIEKTSREKSEEYFSSRPRESQISAWVSEQSAKVPNREFLDRKFKELENKFNGKKIPLPDYWGGYRLVPNYFEYWQARENRLHDRICYKIKDEGWEIFRLAP
jgi:pyridoxamine 5'-phosphate oxidase